MNIDALLSPSDNSSSRDEPSSSTSSPRRPRPSAGGRTPSTLAQEFPRDSPESTTSGGYPSRPSSGHGQQPLSHAVYAPTSQGTQHLPAGRTPSFQVLPQPPTSSPVPPGASPAQHGYMKVPQRPSVTRPTSTPQMETLADLASMRQREQSMRSYSSDSVPSVNNQPVRGSPTGMAPPARRHPSVARLNSTQPSVDFIMAEASSSTPEPGSVDPNVLSQSDSQQVTELLNYLAEKSYAYDSHVQLINLLHQGFVSHASPVADSSSDNEAKGDDPSTYALLSELRQARAAMDTRFAVGEDVWADWLADEMLLASSSEDRIRVTELCQKAVQEEPASVKLWQSYTQWIASNYASCHDLPRSDQNRWTAEDKMMCKELFTRDMLLNVYEQAAAALQWRIDGSHVLWDRYAELLLESMPAQPSGKDIEQIRNVFLSRLQVPHVTWNETKQIFWQVVSRYEGNNWEAIMDEVNKQAAPIQKLLSLREAHESNLRTLMENGDKAAEAEVFSQYLQWEKKQTSKKKAATTFQLRCTLFERALLRFPTNADWWLDYVDFVTSSNSSEPVLPLIERATRHCPWSGDLWGRRILRSDVEGKPREEIEATKHRATNSGLLDVGGMEELLKVLQQWCSYLRRYAFRRPGAEDDRDVAELGITAALDDIEQAGQKLYGKEFKGDPLFRLEKIQLKFLIEARRVQDAREIWRKLVPIQKDSSDFWLTYYNWELWLWGYERLTEPQRFETAANGPHLATAVVQEALSQRSLDWPEKIVDIYLNHFQQHESNEKLQLALIDAREFSKHIAIRRAKEAEEAAQAAAAAAAQQVDSAVSHPETSYDTPNSEKRKREDDGVTNGGPESKRARTEEASAPASGFGEPSASASAQLKRDREHNTLTVKDLPLDVTELEVKKFFRDISAPLSINILQDNSAGTATATVEFESHEDVLAAKTRNGKEVNGHEVRIQSGTQSTLYVANYPAEYDESSMRKLFEGYGEIVSVRFPSLKFNNRRRFCYVQFLTSDMARAAEAALDNKQLDGQHRLLAKISDPDAKKQRSGAQAEGRELFVKNIERSASDDEIREFFEQYGAVVNLNAIKLVSGKRTGTAFIVFSTADEAVAALDANNKPFHDRILHVELASSKARAAPLDRAKKEDINIKQSSPDNASETANNGRRNSDVSSASNPAAAAGADADSWKTARERKIAIFDLPDTVNDARIRAAMETFGPLVKIQMRRADSGAIVEFANVQDAFRVRQGVDCSALGEEVRTGDVGDLLAGVKKRQAGGAEAKTDDADGNGAAASASSKKMLAPPARVSRPAQRGGAARRGGLGFRRGGALGVGSGAVDTAGAAASTGDGAGKKSNAEFRNLFEKSREQQAPAPQQQGEEGEKK